MSAAAAVQAAEDRGALFNLSSYGPSQSERELIAGVANNAANNDISPRPHSWCMHAKLHAFIAATHFSC